MIYRSTSTHKKRGFEGTETASEQIDVGSPVQRKRPTGHRHNENPNIGVAPCCLPATPLLTPLALLSKVHQHADRQCFHIKRTVRANNVATMASRIHHRARIRDLLSRPSPRIEASFHKYLVFPEFEAPECLRRTIASGEQCVRLRPMRSSIVCPATHQPSPGCLA